MVNMAANSADDPWNSHWLPVRQPNNNREAADTPRTRKTQPLDRYPHWPTQLTIVADQDSDTRRQTTRFHNEVLIDWSKLGNWSARHLDLQDGKLPPGLEVVKPLGKGNSNVEMVRCLGTFLAVKTYRLDGNRPVERVNAEISILKRLRHHHVIELVGSMSRHGPGNVISAVFWPVAPCDFGRFFNNIDVLAVALQSGQLQPTATGALIKNELYEEAFQGLREIVFPPGQDNRREPTIKKVLQASIRRIFASFGCLAEALCYVHRQRVSHKDIKPSNILIYPNLATYQSTEANPDGEKVKDGIRLTDFDGAKDISQSEISQVPHTLATARYEPPECTLNGQSGRSADIFSLGCVYFQMTALTALYSWLTNTGNRGCYMSQGDILKELAQSGLTYGLHAHSGRLNGLIGKVEANAQLQSLVQSMVAKEATDRPFADQVLLTLSALDYHQQKRTPADKYYSFFGGCCRRFSIDENFLGRLSDLAENEGTVGGPSREPGHGDTVHLARDSTSPQFEGDNDGNCDGRAHVEDDEPIMLSAGPTVILRDLRIPWNKSDQRIDPPGVPHNRDLFNKIKKMKLCRWRYLLGYCLDRERCEADEGFEHNRILDPETLEAFRAINRRLRVCRSDCTNPACFYGHNCPFQPHNARPEDRTKTSACAYGGPDPDGRCKFPPHMHDMDLQIAYWT